MKKRNRIIKIHNNDFENYNPWVKGLVFGALLGFVLLIIFLLFDYLNIEISFDNITIILIPILSLIIGSILGALLFRKYKN